MPNLPSIAVIIAAGGASTRFGQGNKLLAQVSGEAVFTHCLRNLVGDGVRVVVATNDRAELERLLPQGIGGTWANGGASRTASVANGLEALANSGVLPDFIAVHDAARPFATYELLRDCIATLDTAHADGAIAAHRVTDTIHQVDGNGVLRATPTRDSLWAAETPQCFRRQILLDAYHSWRTAPNPPTFTDDASLVHWAFPDARILFQEHEEDNRKITFLNDL